MKLYDTLTRKPLALPPAPGPIGIYVCGITPYDSPHLGHARAAIVFDALVRTLRELDYTVRYIRNVTDIDDKIIARAAEREVSPVCLADQYTKEYASVVKRLGCLPPDVEPRVSDHIPDIIALIEKLLEQGHAYSAAGSVYFSVHSFPSYGKLSGRRIEELLEGTRVEPGEGKRHPLDFALWKRAKSGEPSWESPWGTGRPGWHIECSTMSMKYLGKTIDIHGGGIDLLFPHHENERAQSEAATGRTFARIWLHNGLVTVNGTKMAKSLGNAFSVEQLLDEFDGNTFRIAVLMTHFAHPFDFSRRKMEEARQSLNRFFTLLPPEANPRESGPIVPAIRRSFLEALRENFNTAKALAVLFEARKNAGRESLQQRLKVARTLYECGRILGLDLFPTLANDEENSEIHRLVKERESARREKRFDVADRIRKELAERGVILEDTPEGTRWRRT
ncbi:MAG: cysteine--tRNA ligase [Candidatus Hydrogenedentota bacterium]|nr:MAG: cysteine--tRNA ligase [Candidatus Hydrogenedentota bacterium]